jgi:DNA-binding response OmpR family regulator
MYKLLIADDEQGIREVLREYAEYDGFTVDEACDGAEAVAKTLNEDYDLIIMDVMMPKMDGFTACKEIRKRSGVPIIMLSARGEEYDKLMGFEKGTDDYVVKPFSPREVLARVNAVIKRKIVPEPKPVVLKFGGLEVNFDMHIVAAEGKELKLTPKEYEIFEYLIKNKNIAISRQKMLSDVWGFEFYGDDRTIDTHIKMLRNNLGKKYRDLIVTIRGMGYKFVPENVNIVKHNG